jgi:hypothetical protein
MTRTRTALAALAAAVLLALALAGCTRTVTVTAKYRSIVGWYFVCDGTGTLFGHWLDPCRKGHVWRVPRSAYDQAVIGRTYTVTL